MTFKFGALKMMILWPAYASYLLLNINIFLVSLQRQILKVFHPEGSITGSNPRKNVWTFHYNQDWDLSEYCPENMATTNTQPWFNKVKNFFFKSFPFMMSTFEQKKLRSSRVHLRQDNTETAPNQCRQKETRYKFRQKKKGYIVAIYFN